MLEFGGRDSASPQGLQPGPIQGTTSYIYIYICIYVYLYICVVEYVYVYTILLIHICIRVPHG